MYALSNISIHLTVSVVFATIIRVLHNKADKI